MGLRNREAVLDFKRDCRDYFYYVSDIRNIMLDMKRLNQKLAGVRAVDMQKVKVRSDPWKTKIVSYIEANTILEKKLRLKQEALAEIYNTIGRTELPTFRVIVWMLYVQRRSLAEVAEIFRTGKEYLGNQVIEQIDAVFDAKIAEGSYIPPEKDEVSSEELLSDTTDDVEIS